MPARPSQRDLEKVYAQAGRVTDSFVASLADGSMTPATWGDRMASMLENRHAQAAVLGRKRAGNLDFASPEDRAWARSLMKGERPFLDAFVGDIRDGRYTLPDGTMNADAIRRRADLYLLKLSGSANRAMAATTDPLAEVIWHLGNAEHCSECPEIAAGSPYTAGTLPAHPGDGSTECLTNCKCHLEYRGGMEGFKPLEGPGEILAEHLPGDHNQKSHGRRAGVKAGTHEWAVHSSEEWDVPGKGKVTIQRGHRVPAGATYRGKGEDYGGDLRDSIRDDVKAIHRINEKISRLPLNQTGLKMEKELEAKAKPHKERALAAIRDHFDATAGEEWPVKAHGMTHEETVRTVKVEGVEYYFTPKTKEAAVKTAAALLANAQVPGVIAGQTHWIAFSTQRNNEDAVWEKKYGILGFTSVATGGDGGITVYNSSHLDLDSAVHEMGHNFAKAEWGETKPPESSGFGKAAKADPNGHVSEYAKVSPNEDFAESVSMYVRMPWNLRWSSRPRYEAIDEMVRKGRAREAWEGETLAEFDPHQPRNEKGEWTHTGASKGPSNADLARMIMGGGSLSSSPKKAPTLPSSVDEDVMERRRQAIGEYLKTNPHDKEQKYSRTVDSHDPEFKPLMDAMREHIPQADIAINVTPAALGKVLDEGRFKSSFETNRNFKGKQDISNPYMTRRQQVEREQFGFRGSSPDRPIYGYLAGPNGEGEGEARNYGGVRVVLKPDVKARTTFTMGDSLNWKDFAAPSKMLDPQPETLHNIRSKSAEDQVKMKLMSEAATEDRFLKIHATMNEYAEAQVHGGVHVADIAKVVIPKRMEKTTSLRVKLKKAGIPIEEA